MASISEQEDDQGEQWGCNVCHEPKDTDAGICDDCRQHIAFSWFEAHPEARRPVSVIAQAEDNPWCRWTLGFAEGSDWDTAMTYAFDRLLNLSFRLTTADGRSRPVRLVSSQYIDEQYAAAPTGDCERKSGIEVMELETEDYEPIPGGVLERVPYEDVREVVVF